MSTHELRRQWKPHKLRLQELQPDHPTNVRFHRACSWLQRVEQMADGQDLDLALTCQWIAFNSLYGQWDAKLAEPRPDRECWRTFLDRMLALDAEGHIADLLVEHKKLALTILDDSYLAGFFWKNPSTQQALKKTRDRHQAPTWYLEKRWSLILEQVLERIYLLRCQLMHGAATHGSRLNRTSLRHGTWMLGHLMGAFMHIWIDHGSDEDWGPMCYPPVG